MSLDAAQNQAFHRREWAATRVGWVLIAAFLIAGLLGLLGPGPFSSSTVQSPRGLVSVEFERMGHNEADDAVTIRVDEAAVSDGKVTVHVTGEWPAHVDLASVSPTPSAEYAIDGGVAYEFEALGSGDVEAVLTFRADAYGPLGATVAVDGDAVEFNQFILP